MRNIKIVIFAIFGLTIVYIAGCASNRINLVDNGTVSIERVSSQRTLVSKVYVYQQEEELVISGRVRRRLSTGLAGGGHVDITVLNQEGKPIKNISKGYLPRWIKHSRTSSFTVHLPLIISEASIVRVVHHSGAPHENQGI